MKKEKQTAGDDTPAGLEKDNAIQAKTSQTLS
jgi:hypothetical protein